MVWVEARVSCICQDSRRRRFSGIIQDRLVPYCGCVDSAEGENAESGRNPDWLSERSRAAPLDPAHPIGAAPGATIGDFWAWSASDLAANTMRGVFAEFIVARALGDERLVRTEWDLADVVYRRQYIEVKCSADYQTWTQQRPSKIVFDVAPKTAWNAETNEVSAEPVRSAAAYAFCHYRGRASAEAVVDPSWWDFYVLSTALIDKQLGDHRTITLNPLRQLTAGVRLAGLRPAVDAALGV